MSLTAFSIPSPSQGVVYLGDFPLRGYAICVILGIVAAIWIGERRWAARGGRVGEIQDIAIWAVPFGLVGARAYHVATDWDLYFGEGRRPIEALYIWQGGLGIWGAIALGAVGALIGARRMGLRFLPLADALAPGLLVGQAIGRWGNWFNQELFGRPTDLPWGLEIDVAARPSGYAEFATFHPTFLYEFLWNLVAAALIVWLDRRFRLGHGRVLALYVLAYTAGRFWNESLRIDEVQLNDVLGLRWNVWMSIALFIGAAVYLLLSRGRGREDSVYTPERRERDAAEEAEIEAAGRDGATGASGAGTKRAGALDDASDDPADDPVDDPAVDDSETSAKPGARD